VAPYSSAAEFFLNSIAISLDLVLSTEDSATIDIRNASKRYAGVQALRSVDFMLRRGEVHCLIGENGSGKSTLIKIMTGVVRPDAGTEIFLRGTRRTHLTPAESAANGIQAIYQDFSLFPNLTVAENISLPKYRRRGLRILRRKKMREEAAQAIARVGLSLDPRQRVSELSIAGRQMTAICRALAAEAWLVIMDEPTASLAKSEVEQLLRVVSELKTGGISTLFVSHRLEEVKRIADEVTVLRDGRKVGTFPAADMSASQLSELMTGTTFSHQKRTRAPTSTATPVLEVKHLTVPNSFSDISFEVAPGEVLGIIGRLGSGRTTLAMTLFGMLKPHAGEIRLRGAPVRFSSNRQAVSAGVAYLSEDRLNLGLVLPQSISRNVIITTIDRRVRRLGTIDARQTEKSVRQVLADLAVRAPDLDKPVQTLSGGNQQRIAIAKWLATDPALLILDSPTVGVDISAKAGIYRIIRRLSEQGLSVILISDEPSEVLENCHRILVMNEGIIKDTVYANDVDEQTLEKIVDA
jgi:simple sugar transport system ATP-binding protein